MSVEDVAADTGAAERAVAARAVAAKLAVDLEAAEVAAEKAEETAAEADVEAEAQMAEAASGAGDASAAEPGARPSLTDLEASAWLEEFQSRPLPDQQASPVWQALAGFPQWSSAQYPDKAPDAKPPIDPRLRGEALLKEQQRRGEWEAETLKSKQDPSGQRSISTHTIASGVNNPWADYREPDPGPAYFGVNTNVKPPFSGEWARVPNGWHRKN